MATVTNNQSHPPPPPLMNSDYEKNEREREGVEKKEEGERDFVR